MFSLSLKTEMQEFQNHQREDEYDSISEGGVNSSLTTPSFEEDSNDDKSNGCLSLLQRMINEAKNEAERRKARVTQMRITGTTKTTSSPLNDDINMMRLPHPRRSSNSIMTIRTLEESLETTNQDSNWKNVVDNRRRRTRLQKRMYEIMKDMNGTPGRDGAILGRKLSTGGNTAEIVTETDHSSKASYENVSTQKFHVRFENVMIREHFMIPGDNPRYVFMILRVGSFTLFSSGILSLFA